MTFGPDGKHLYVTGGSDSTVSVFERDGTSGQLSLVEIEQHGQNDVSDAGDTVEGLVVFERNASSGKLSFVETDGLTM